MPRHENEKSSGSSSDVGSTNGKSESMVPPSTKPHQPSVLKAPPPRADFTHSTGTKGHYFQVRTFPLKDAGTGDVYDATLPRWRAAIRRRLVQIVERETITIAWIQKRVRTPWLDNYFVYTSALGTHTFFMTFLPALFFFGHAEIGRGLLVVLATGVYCTSFVKDLLCSPRPFAPPVTRLTMGTHHLEYGFPSTHSANSVSIALFFFTLVHRLASVDDHESVRGGDGSPALSPTAYILTSVALVWYVLSIVLGRLYTAMHSFTDCIAGFFMGAGIWWVHDGYWGLGAGAWVERLVEENGIVVPLVLILLCGLMVNQHPQPVDDCPCFEDAIAFVSVVLGSLLARWHATHYGFDERFFQNVMPGVTWADTGVWCVFAVVKMVVGVLVIFSWRILAKSTLHMVLPPTFRLLAHAFTLPHRRFYTPATDYGSVPSDLGLRPIPSMVDLPHELRVGEEGAASGVRIGERRVKMRGGSVVAAGNGGGGRRELERWELERNGEEGKEVKHYDADVLTKVIVYCGIAILACEVLPVMFEMFGRRYSIVR